MTVYIALLRGINVGGKNVIKMAELKRVFEAIGLCDVKTYIQSGNVLFRSDEVEELLKIKIESELEASFGFLIPVVLRTKAELEQIINNCPFSESQISEAEAASDAESLYVALMAKSPEEGNKDRLKAYKSESDDYVIIGREVYLLFRNSIRNSKLAGSLHKLEVPSTVRNWKTLSKLYALAKEIS